MLSQLLCGSGTHRPRDVSILFVRWTPEWLVRQDASASHVKPALVNVSLRSINLKLNGSESTATLWRKVVELTERIVAVYIGDDRRSCSVLCCESEYLSVLLGRSYYVSAVLF